jgi:hypothetical protein
MPYSFSPFYHQDKDTLKDLRASIYYYEHVADANGDATRKTNLETTVIKLKKILVKIEDELQGNAFHVLQANMFLICIRQQLTVELPNSIRRLLVYLTYPNYKTTGYVCLFFIDAQQYLTVVQYDLRVVLFHDGLFGRKHIYSYVQGEGVWWKTVDTEVTEVTSNRSHIRYLNFLSKVSEEAVLTDPAGLHLGAGPYLLLYSRALTSEEARNAGKLPWIEGLKVLLFSLPYHIPVLNYTNEFEGTNQVQQPVDAWYDISRKDRSSCSHVPSHGSCSRSI